MPKYLFWKCVWAGRSPSLLVSFLVTLLFIWLMISNDVPNIYFSTKLNYLFNAIIDRISSIINHQYNHCFYYYSQYFILRSKLWVTIQVKRWKPHLFQTLQNNLLAKIRNWMRYINNDIITHNRNTKLTYCWAESRFKSYS